MTQNQATFERGFVLATPVNHSKKTHKSSRIKPIPNEVFALRHTWNQAKNAKNKAKSSEVFTRFSPFATQDKDKDKETDDQDYDKER
jgi:hypothetical protein